jgi:glycosyltransferase involved in cell wall biosynthesis
LRRKPETLPLTGKMRVLFAIGEMSGGGSQRQLIGILQRLDRSRFIPQLYLVSPGGELLPEVPADVPVHVFAERCKQNRWWYPGQAHRARVRDLAETIRQERIDLVYDRTYHMTLITAPAARRAGVPRISVVVADPAFDIDTNRERFRFVKRSLLRGAYRTADRVIAVSEGVRTAVEAYYGLPPGKAITVYNFFDIERIDRLMAEPLPAGETKQSGRFEVVAAGRLHPQKGFNYLLEAVRELVRARGLEQLHLRILGSGPLEAELRSYVAQHRLESYVTLSGFRQNPLPFFRQADLYCLSSLYEGMPNTLVEAMLCRVPVLATDCPSGPREILQEGRFGKLVPPGDAQSLTEAIADAVINPDKWQQVVPAARTHIERTFAPDIGIQQLQSLLIQTCEMRTKSK